MRGATRQENFLKRILNLSIKYQIVTSDNLLDSHHNKWYNVLVVKYEGGAYAFLKTKREKHCENGRQEDVDDWMGPDHEGL